MKSAKEQLYSDLKKKILTLVLEPGANLDEVNISSEYGISRTPLRDVFRRLQGEGYLELIENRGASVTSMNYTTMRDYFVTAPMIYVAVARLAAQKPDKSKIPELKDAQFHFRNAVQRNEIGDMIVWNDRFHLIVGEMANNDYLQPSLRRLLIDHARIGQTFWHPSDSEARANVSKATDQHDQLIAAIESSNLEEAMSITQAHWELSREYADKLIRPDPLPMTMGE